MRSKGGSGDDDDGDGTSAVSDTSCAVGAAGARRRRVLRVLGVGRRTVTRMPAPPTSARCMSLLDECGVAQA